MRLANSTLSNRNGAKLLPLVNPSGSSMQQHSRQMNSYLRTNTQNMENSILTHSPDPVSR